jgi:integrase
MASLYKPTITAYRLPDGKFRTPDGKRVTKNTVGAVKVSRKSEIWYGKYKTAGGNFVRLPLCADKTASKQMLAKLVIEAKMAEHGMGDRYAKHLVRPLTEHLEEFAAALVADGDTAKHVQNTVSCVRSVLAGCGFVFIRDLSASPVQAFLADLRTRGRARIELGAGKEWFTKAELVQALGLHPNGVALVLRRHGLHGAGNGKARRYPRAALEYLQHRLCRGVGIATINAYLRAVKSFAAWLVRDRRSGDNPLSHLAAGNARLDPRHERRALSVEFLRRVLDAASTSSKEFRGLLGSDRAMLYATAMGTGFRSGEMASLVPNSFDLTSDPPTATVEAAYAKNRQQAVQPISSDLAALLRKYLADKPVGQPVWPGTWSEDGAEMLRIDLNSAGIPYRDADGRVADFHALRHSYITLIAQSGVHPKMAQSLARHSTITLTMDRYAHVTLYEQATAIESLPRLMSAKIEHEITALPATGTEGHERLRPRLDQTGALCCDHMRVSESNTKDEGDGRGRRNPLVLRDVETQRGGMREDEKIAPCRGRTIRHKSRFHERVTSIRLRGRCKIRCN